MLHRVFWLTVELSYFVITITISALGEDKFVTTYLIYLAYIFEDLFARLGQVLIMAIIARTITEDLGVLSQKITSFFIGLLWLVAIAGFGFQTAVYASVISHGRPDEIGGLGSLYMGITFASYLFFISLYLAVLAIMAVFKRNATVCAPPYPFTSTNS
jgi:hypothetical protein